MIAMNQSNIKAYNNVIRFQAQESISLGYDAMPQCKSVRDIMENIFERERSDTTRNLKTKALRFCKPSHNLLS